MICGHQLALRHLGRKLIKLVRILVLYRSMETVVCQGILGMYRLACSMLCTRNRRHTRLGTLLPQIAPVEHTKYAGSARRECTVRSVAARWLISPVSVEE